MITEDLRAGAWKSSDPMNAVPRASIGSNVKGRRHGRSGALHNSRRRSRAFPVVARRFNRFRNGIESVGIAQAKARGSDHRNGNSSCPTDDVGQTDPEATSFDPQLVFFLGGELGSCDTRDRYVFRSAAATGDGYGVLLLSCFWSKRTVASATTGSNCVPVQHWISLIASGLPTARR